MFTRTGSEMHHANPWANDCGVADVMPGLREIADLTRMNKNLPVDDNRPNVSHDELLKTGKTRAGVQCQRP